MRVIHEEGRPDEKKKENLVTEMCFFDKKEIQRNTDEADDRLYRT